MKRILHQLLVALISSTLFFSCSQHRYSCSAYSQKIERKLQKGNINKVIDYLSPYIDYSEAFSISVFGQTEIIHNKEEFSSFLPQLTENVLLTKLETDVQTLNSVQSLIHITNNKAPVMDLHVMQLNHKVALLHIDFYSKKKESNQLAKV